MSDGISALRVRKAERAGRQAPPPRHPKSAVPQVEPAAEGQDDDGGNLEAKAVASTPAPLVLASAATHEVSVPSASAPVEPDGDTLGGRMLPELEIDWADPLMHVASPTRVSVAGSVVARFKAVADQPGAAPQTELIMESVSAHLAQLPELVLQRRPEETTAAPSGFFVRRAAVQKAEPPLPVYMRPIAGEVEALRRIVDWVNGIILDGHPGRSKTTRSEVVTAALDANYPAAPRRHQ